MERARVLLHFETVVIFVSVSPTDAEGELRKWLGYSSECFFFTVERPSAMA
jgi:hypothetical protein